MHYAAARPGRGYNFHRFDQNVSVTLVTGLRDSLRARKCLTAAAFPVLLCPKPCRNTRGEQGATKGRRMAEKDWLRPERLVEAPGTAWAGQSSARLALRPLSLGEVLDRSFSLYRSRFPLFAAITMVSAAGYTVAQGVSLATASRLLHSPLTTPTGNSPVAVLTQLRMVSTAQARSYAVLLLFFLVSAVTQAASAWAVAELYLQKPVDARSALKTVAPRWARWIGIALWQMASAFSIPAVLLLLALALSMRSHSVGLAALGGVLLALAFFGGFPAGVVLYLRNALAVPAAAVEELTVQQAMQRSKVLTRGSKGRIFVVLLVAFVLLEVVGVLQAPLGVLVVLGRGGAPALLRGLALLLTFAGHTVVAPVAAIGLTLMYFDQRVRLEALDIDLLLRSGEDHAPPA